MVVEPHDPTSSITIYARSVLVVQTEGIEAEKVSRGRYMANAALFAVFMLLLTLWFTLHVESYVTQKAIVGGVTLYALAQLVLSLGKKDFEDVAADMRKRWLASPRTTRTLGILIFCAAGLFAVTSSLYFKVDGYDGRVRLEVLTQTGRLMPSVELDRDVRGGGQPFFPRFTRENVRVVVKEPRGWRLSDPKPPFAFYPWSRREIIFPKNFTKLDYHVLRIVPGVLLNDDLNGCNDCRLLITTPKGVVVADIPSYQFQTVYTGTPDIDDLQPFAERDREKLRSELGHYIATSHADEFRETYLALWLGNPSFAASRRDLAHDEDLIIKITKDRAVLLSVPEKAPHDDLKTVILRGGPS